MVGHKTMTALAQDLPNEISVQYLKLLREKSIQEIPIFLSKEDIMNSYQRLKGLHHQVILPILQELNLMHFLIQQDQFFLPI